jgi:hypothetical protein
VQCNAGVAAAHLRHRRTEADHDLAARQVEREEGLDVLHGDPSGIEKDRPWQIESGLVVTTPLVCGNQASETTASLTPDAAQTDRETGRYHAHAHPGGACGRRSQRAAGALQSREFGLKYL